MMGIRLAGAGLTTLRCALLYTALLAPPATAADSAVVLRYRFDPGATLVYVTTSTLAGGTTLRAGSAEPRSLELSTRVTHRVAYRVLAVDASGAARVQVSLLSLQITNGDSATLLGLTRDGELVRVERPDGVWSLGPGDPLPSDLALSLDGLDPRDLLAASVRLITPAGQVSPVSGHDWTTDLARLPGLGQLGPLVQPFAGLPQLPTRALRAGQPWAQTREVPLPGDPTQSYPLELTYAVGTAAEGEPNLTLVPFQGLATAEERLLRLDVLPQLRLPLVLQSLQHRVTGQLTFAAAAGNLVEQRLQADIDSVSSGALDQRSFTLESRLTLTSTMRLAAN